MSATIYIFEPERRSREPDAQPERDPSGATIVVLPVARGDHDGPPCDVAFQQGIIDVVDAIRELERVPFLVPAWPRAT
jgi:hypothetical protein